MDRIDLWAEVGAVSHETLTKKLTEEKISPMLKRIVGKARARQLGRFKEAGRGITQNSEMNVRDLAKLVELSPEIHALLEKAARQLSLSPRAYHRIIKISRTIADLDEQDNIEPEHVLEALQYRPKKIG